jgi:hypothetical protein
LPSIPNRSEPASAARSSSSHLYTNEHMFENINLYESLGYSIAARKTESGFRRVYLTN